MEPINVTHDVEQMLQEGTFANIYHQVLSEYATVNDRLVAEEAIAKVLTRMRDAINGNRDVIMDTPLLKAHIDRWGWSFVRAGVVVRNQLGQYLCVEDTRCRIGGVYQTVYDVWNLSAGCAKTPLESFQQTAVREAREETGYSVQLTGLVYVKRKLDVKSPHVMAVYMAEIVDDATRRDFDHKEIRSLRWMTYDEIMDLKRQNKLRSPDFILEAVRRCETGKPLPLSTIVE